jgi:hypothetical protein
LVGKVALSVVVLLTMSATFVGKNLFAQTAATQPTTSVQQQKDAKPTRSRSAAANAYVAVIEAKPMPDAIAAPAPATPAPIWPADQPPNQAKVSWDSRGLEIEASNSSLDQILRQVAADTGIKLEGLTQDQRIFGTYGPGPARDVLSQLLEGSGNNVLMIGGRGADDPLRVVFSASAAAGPQTAANNQGRGSPQDEDAADPPDPEPPPAPAMKTPFGNGDSGAPETQQQIMQDILGRQQKIDQGQQPQGQQNSQRQ